MSKIKVRKCFNPVYEFTCPNCGEDRISKLLIKPNYFNLLGNHEDEVLCVKCNKTIEVKVID